MAYNKTVWVNGQLPAINADNLNKIEDEIEDLSAKGDILQVSTNKAELVGDDFTFLDITTTANDPYISLNQITDVSNWSIFNDSSDNNSLDFRYNNVSKMNLDKDGNLTLAGSGGGGSGTTEIRVNTTTASSTNSTFYVDMTSYNIDFNKIVGIYAVIETSSTTVNSTIEVIRGLNYSDTTKRLTIGPQTISIYNSKPITVTIVLED